MWQGLKSIDIESSKHLKIIEAVKNSQISSPKYNKNDYIHRPNRLENKKYNIT